MSTQQTTTEALLDYIHGTTFESIPRDVVTELNRCLVDGFAVMLAG